MMGRIEIDQERCKGCGLCTIVCPKTLIKIGEEINDQCFWVTGIFRENYDLVYPYLKPGGKIPFSEINSASIYNYDICIKSIIRDSNKQTPALEVLSGGIREWLYETILERLLDNGIIPERPVMSNGNILNYR
jgi:ferredoxin